MCLASCLSSYYGTGTYCTIRLYEYSEGHACNDWKALGGYTMCGPRSPLIVTGQAWLSYSLSSQVWHTCRSQLGAGCWVLAAAM
eukprot:SAG25_NODE_8659_length_410_cov_1.167203_1_plen_83_part_10